MLTASSCRGWGSLQGLRFCPETHTCLWGHLSGLSVYVLGMGEDFFFLKFSYLEREIIYVVHCAQMELGLA